MLAKKLRDTALATAAAGALMIGMGVGAANAGTALSLLTFQPDTILEDNDFESLIDRAAGGTAGILDVGDTLRGILEIQAFKNGDLSLTSNLNASSGNNTLTGLFEVEVKSKTATGIFADFDPGLGINLQQIFTYEFGVYAPFAATVGAAAGTMIALYEDTVDDFLAGTTCTTGSGGTCEGSVTDGTLWMTLGFGSDAGGTDATTGAKGDERWRATGPADPTVADNFAVTANVVGDIGGGIVIGAGFAYNLSILDNLSGLNLGQVGNVPGAGGTGGNGLIDFSGAGNLKGTQTTGVTPIDATNYDITSDLDASFNVIAEPATLGIMGLGLLGLGALARRRRKS